ncbi:MAG: hypothetical protein LBE84_03765 [Planctomycetota bacterium]|jgi:Tfp pilus assembly protein PilN|nr:hypothetical protein [Planctomycetota bacterium]
MITINLLPEVMRKKSGMPVMHFIGICAGVAIFALLGYAVFYYTYSVIPALTQRRAVLDRQKKERADQAGELKKIEADIAKYANYVNAVKTLYRNRVVWAKILADIKNIVNFDPSMSFYNSDMRHIWFTKMTGSGKTITLNGFATAATETEAMQMPELLLKEFRVYAPVTLPEKDEEERLRTRLKTVMIEYEALRRNNPDLPLLGPEEEDIRKRLEDIKNIKSGGIATIPFLALISPESLRLINVNWSAAPRPRGQRTDSSGNFPNQAWSFGITMSLK